MKVYTHDLIDLPDLVAETNEQGERYYTVSREVSYPSITTVLGSQSKTGIEEWRKRIGPEAADKITRQAGRRGTAFHNMAERFLKNRPMVMSTLTFLEMELFEVARPELEKIDNIRMQEQALYSDYLRIAGRVDVVADFEGVRSIIDFKTARAEKNVEYVESYFMQAAGYAIMVEERSKLPVANLVVIIANEDGFVQVFKRKRDDYVKSLLYYRDLYEENHR